MPTKPVVRKLARAAVSRRGLSLFLSLLLLTAGLLPAPRAASAAPRATAPANGGTAAPEAEYVPGEVLVRFREDSPVVLAEKGGAAAEFSGRAGDRMVVPLLAADGERIEVGVERFGGSEIVEGLRLGRVEADRTLEAIAALNAREDVLYAEPNYIYRKTDTPNDPHFSQQYALQRISAPSAWDVTKGSQDVVVGIVDSGFDIGHEDLKDNVWINPGETPNDNVDNDGNGYADDVNGWDFYANDKTVFDGATEDDHGTHVAGIVGARGNNGAGVAGVNWQVRLMSIKVLGGASGSSKGSSIINGLNYARQMRERGVNLRVLNNSYGGSGFSNASRDAIAALGNAGILFVAAAGNESRDNFGTPHYPSDYDLPNVIGVASTNSPDNLSGFSNFGARVVSMGAPGSGILSTTPRNYTQQNSGIFGADGSTYSFFGGTSMATPHVTGAAALVAAANPGIPVQRLRGVLAYSGDPLPSLAEKTTTGRRLNARAAINSALENDATPPSAPALQVSAQSGRTVTLSWMAPGDDGEGGTASDYDFFFVSPSGARTLLPTSLLPAGAGAAQTATVALPYLNFGGTVELRTYDNAGNFSTASVGVSVGQNAGSDPYVVAQGAGGGLSSGGEKVLDGDDRYLENYGLALSFPYFGQARTALTVSTNGVLYFGPVPKRDNGDADDVPSSTAALRGSAMIAGLWDDIDLRVCMRADAGVYVVRPDANRVIFRWQGVRFQLANCPASPQGEQVNFEIELRSDGTIIYRYGDGNTNLHPVVGLGAGEPDAYVVPSHTSEAALKNLTNAPSVTFSVRSDPPPPPANRIDDTTFFVQQHYRDFFNREADQAGLAFWTGQITSCGSDANCIDFRRSSVSAAFFLSVEFQQTGYLVYRMYLAAYGNRVANTVPLTFQEFLPDLQAIGQGVVVNAPGWEQQLEANKQNYASAFAARPDFAARYGSVSHEEFVNGMNTNAGGVLSVAERDSLVSRLYANQITRAQALREVAEDADLFARERNRAFVLMQYFGYLRRNPHDAPEATRDFAGYNFWLAKLNQFGGDALAAEMVRSFLVSGEYRQRFGP